MQYTLVTGACGGLGRAFCELLAARGERLFLTGTSEERLFALSEELRARYPGLCVLFRPCDLKDSAAREEFFAAADACGATFSRLVYVAGVDTQMAFEKYDEARIVAQARVNLEGAVSFLSGVIARAPLDGATELLTVGSMSGTVPMPYFALYSATKRALLQFTCALHEELKGRAKVTCVLPGGMPTRPDIVENIKTHGLFGKLSALPPQKVAAASLLAVQKNRRKKVVGFWNQLLYFTECVLPMSVKTRVICRIWRNTEKDHFA